MSIMYHRTPTMRRKIAKDRGHFSSTSEVGTPLRKEDAIEKYYEPISTLLEYSMGTAS